jgi:hypothetical protein
VDGLGSASGWSSGPGLIDLARMINGFDCAGRASERTQSRAGESTHQWTESICRPGGTDYRAAPVWEQGQHPAWVCLR